MLKEFKEFLNRGNVIDLAVAVILGGAFGAIVKSLVADIIMPLLGVIMGGTDLTSLVIEVGDAVITYGVFLQAIINFIVIAFVVFLFIRSYNNMQKEEEAKPAAPPAPPAEEVLLTEIRDLLKKQR